MCTLTTLLRSSVYGINVYEAFSSVNVVERLVNLWLSTLLGNLHKSNHAVLITLVLQQL